MNIIQHILPAVVHPVAREIPTAIVLFNPALKAICTRKNAHPPAKSQEIELSGTSLSLCGVSVVNSSSKLPLGNSK
jgi:hypothetical protein